MEPENRLEAFLMAIAGIGGAPTPVTREEILLKAIADRLSAIQTEATTPELPDDPTANGAYVLTATKSSSGVALTWESAAD